MTDGKCMFALVEDTAVPGTKAPLKAATATAGAAGAVVLVESWAVLGADADETTLREGTLAAEQNTMMVLKEKHRLEAGMGTVDRDNGKGKDMSHMGLDTLVEVHKVPWAGDNRKGTRVVAYHTEEARTAACNKDKEAVHWERGGNNKRVELEKDLLTPVVRLLAQRNRTAPVELNRSVPS